MPSKVWLITGASSGFGLAMTRCALGRGDRVLATLRNPATLDFLTSQYPSAQLVLAPLDVTRPEEIKAAFQRAKAAFGRVDVVFNNAGYVVGGEVESVPDDAARKMFEVNFWGAAHVSQEAVRFFREENVPQGGHLIQHSAAVGIVGYPALGFYSASKHALEGLTKSIYKEIDPKWNIRITSVESGAFKTDIMSALQLAPQHPAYADPSSIASTIRKSIKPSPQPKEDDAVDRFGLKDTAKGVQKIYDLAMLPNPPLHCPLGSDSIELLRDFVNGLSNVLETYGGWSEDLQHEGVSA